MLRRITTAVLTLALALPAAAGAADEGPAFDTLIDDIGRTMLSRFPEAATDLGLSQELGLDDHALDDLSYEFRAETAALAEEALARLSAVVPAALTADERVTLAVTEWYVEDIVTMHEHADHEYALNFITGAHANLPEFMADVHPLEDLDDAEAFVARLEASGAQLRQVADNLRRSEAAGNLPTERSLGIAAWQLGSQTFSAANHPIRTDLAERLAAADLEQTEVERLLAEAEDALDQELVPAYEALQSAASRAATRSDTEPGVLHHVDGEAYYAAVLAHHLSVPLTPAEVHEIGLAEVERLRAELSEAMSELGVDANDIGFAEAIAAVSATAPVVPLRNDDDREALLADTEAFIAETSATFEDLFHTLPSSPLEVRRPRPGREGPGARTTDRRRPSATARASTTSGWRERLPHGHLRHHELPRGHPGSPLPAGAAA